MDIELKDAQWLMYSACLVITYGVKGLQCTENIYDKNKACNPPKWWKRERTLKL